MKQRPLRLAKLEGPVPVGYWPAPFLARRCLKDAASGSRWRGGRVVDRSGLEKRYACKGIGIRIPSPPPVLCGSDPDG